MTADIGALLAQMQQPAAPPADPASPVMDPSMLPGQGAPLDPAMTGAPVPAMPGAGMGGAGAFTSTDPSMIAQAVQACLDQLADQDHQALGLQQQHAATLAQPIIDQMLAQIGAPEQSEMPSGSDPMMAFGEGPMPPMPTDPMMG